MKKVVRREMGRRERDREKGKDNNRERKDERGRE